ncbi:MAG: hypothetical protein JXB05_36285 [Myxococcaceae bacterium]|nr:hypothetical protein [Myxococcaceae bacterium]
MKPLWVMAVALCLACHETGTKSISDQNEGEDTGGEVQPPPPPPPGGGGETCPPRCPPPPPPEWTREPAPNPIPAENANPGAPQWRDGIRSYAGQVELYTSTDSVMAGETVRVMVSTDVEAQVEFEVYRLGYYGGAGARRVWRGGPFATQKQPACPREPDTSLVECHWKETFSFEVPATWVSGMYVVKAKRSDGFKRFHPFVVRDSRAAEVLFTPAFNTYQAYNIYGGESLYFDASGTMPLGRAYAVSYNRPYDAYEGLGKTFDLDLALLRLLEQHGYDVTYASNLDFARHSNLLEGIGALVHGSQDEYWLSEERAQVDAALAAGTLSLAYFGGNGAYWRTRTLSDADGQPLRTLVCYKGVPLADPIPYSTVRFRDPPQEQPENGLFGVMYDGWQVVPFPLVVADAQHWLFEGTGLKRGDQLAGLVGYEFDRTWDNGFHPDGLRVAMESPVVTAEGLPNVTHAVERTLPNGRRVFAAGTIYWALALGAHPELTDARVIRMTLNVLERSLEHRRPRRTLTTPPGPFPAGPRIKPAWAPLVEAFAGAPGAPGYQDGPAATARFNGPTGLAVMANGAVVVADTNNNRVRLVRLTGAGRMVMTLAGNGQDGWRDGEGLQAMFRRPTGVAVGLDGSIYVADSDNHAIRRLTPGAGGPWTVSTFAGQVRREGFQDGPVATARFSRPTALATDTAGNLYVADQAGNRIRLVNVATGTVTTLAGDGVPGFLDATQGTQARFNNPSALSVAPDGTVYVLDSGNQRVRRIAPTAAHPVETIAGDENEPFGHVDGRGSQARFRAQMGMAVLPGGQVLVADTANFRLRKLEPGNSAAETQVYTVAGSGLMGTRLGSGQETDLVAPTGLVVLPNTRIVVSDSFNNTLRMMTR